LPRHAVLAQKPFFLSANFPTVGPSCCHREARQPREANSSGTERHPLSDNLIKFRLTCAGLGPCLYVSHIDCHRHDM
jgi:hypothetical protein